MSPTESCASFLRREFEAKRSGLLAIRRYMFLVLIPPMACILVGRWLACGTSQSLELEISGRRSIVLAIQVRGGPWPLIIMGFVLVLDWLAFGLAAKKATRELEELRRRTQE
jgi:hypothetical protein